MRIRNQRNKRPPKKQHLVNNDMLRFPIIFLIDDDGSRIGAKRPREAIAIAKERGLDLVLISGANSKIPVAKLMDYGKYKYVLKKRTKKMKIKQAVTVNREIRITPLIGEQDLKTKAKKAREFLLDSNRVKVSLKFRGRERGRQDLGTEILDKFYAFVSDIASKERAPKLTNNRFLDMYLVRDKKKAQKIIKKENANA